MSLERSLPLIRERKQAILAGDPERVAEQKKLNKLTARERIDQLFDEATFVELDALSGRDGKTGVVTGCGLVDGRQVYVYAQDYTSMGGAVGADHGRKVGKIMDLALKNGAPVVAMFDSRGGRLLEGADTVNAYALMAAKTAMLSGVVPQIALIMGECAGSAATIAAMNDIVISSNAARLFVNGAQVVSANTDSKVDEKTYGGKEHLDASGIAHLSADGDEEAVALARTALNLLPANNLEDAPLDFTVGDDVARSLSEFDAIESVSDIKALMTALVDQGSFLELCAKYEPSMVTALARIGGQSVGIIGNQPLCDGGSLTVDGCVKAARFVRLMDCFNIPVVTVIDTVGMAVVTPCCQAKLARASAQLAYALSEATVAKVALVVGKAIGAGYMILASRTAVDAIYAWPGCVISPLAAPAAVQVLMEEELKGKADALAQREALERDYQENVADGLNAAKLGYVDDVIVPSESRSVMAVALNMLASKREARPPKKHGNLPL